MGLPTPVLSVADQSTTVSLSVDLLPVGSCKVQHPSCFLSVRTGLFAWPFLPVLACSSALSISAKLLLVGPYKNHHPSWFLLVKNGLFALPVLPAMGCTRSLQTPASYWAAWTLPLLIFPYRCSLQPEDGSNMVLRNNGILPHHYSVTIQMIVT